MHIFLIWNIVTSFHTVLCVPHYYSLIINLHWFDVANICDMFLLHHSAVNILFNCKFSIKFVQAQSVEVRESQKLPLVVWQYCKMKSIPTINVSYSFITITSSFTFDVIHKFFFLGKTGVEMGPNQWVPRLCRKHFVLLFWALHRNISAYRMEISNRYRFHMQSDFFDSAVLRDNTKYYNSYRIPY
jgi:hypothetical protein